MWGSLYVSQHMGDRHMGIESILQSGWISQEVPGQPRLRDAPPFQNKAKIKIIIAVREEEKARMGEE